MTPQYVATPIYRPPGPREQLSVRVAPQYPKAPVVQLVNRAPGIAMHATMRPTAQGDKSHGAAQLTVPVFTSETPHRPPLQMAEQRAVVVPRSIHSSSVTAKSPPVTVASKQQGAIQMIPRHTVSETHQVSRLPQQAQVRPQMSVQPTNQAQSVNAGSGAKTQPASRPTVTIGPTCSTTAQVRTHQPISAAQVDQAARNLAQEACAYVRPHGVPKPLQQRQGEVVRAMLLQQQMMKFSPPKPPAQNVRVPGPSHVPQQGPPPVPVRPTVLNLSGTGHSAPTQNPPWYPTANVLPNSDKVGTQILPQRFPSYTAVATPTRQTVSVIDSLIAKQRGALHAGARCLATLAPTTTTQPIRFPVPTVALQTAGQSNTETRQRARAPDSSLATSAQVSGDVSKPMRTQPEPPGREVTLESTSAPGFVPAKIVSETAAPTSSERLRLSVPAVTAGSDTESVTSAKINSQRVSTDTTSSPLDSLSEPPQVDGPPFQPPKSTASVSQSKPSPSVASLQMSSLNLQGPRLLPSGGAPRMTTSNDTPRVDVQVSGARQPTMLSPRQTTTRPPEPAWLQNQTLRGAPSGQRYPGPGVTAATIPTAAAASLFGPGIPLVQGGTPLQRVALLAAHGLQQCVSTQRGPPPSYESSIATAPPASHGATAGQAGSATPKRSASHDARSTSSWSARDIYDNLSDVTDASKEEIDAVGIQRRPVGEPGNKQSSVPKKETKAPKYKCGECLKSFNYRNVLTEHIEQNHHKQGKDVVMAIIRTGDDDAAAPVNLVVERNQRRNLDSGSGETKPGTTIGGTVSSTIAGASTTTPNLENSATEATILDLTSERNNNLKESKAKDEQRTEDDKEEYVDPETRKIREILMKMNADEVQDLFRIAQSIHAGRQQQPQQQQSEPKTQHQTGTAEQEPSTKSSLQQPNSTSDSGGQDVRGSSGQQQSGSTSSSQDTRYSGNSQIVLGGSKQTLSGTSHHLNTASPSQQTHLNLNPRSGLFMAQPARRSMNVFESRKEQSGVAVASGQQIMSSSVVGGGVAYHQPIIGAPTFSPPSGQQRMISSASPGVPPFSSSVPPVNRPLFRHM